MFIVKDNVFCPIPWNFSAIRSNGDFRVCCHANQSESKGLLQDSSGKSMNAVSHSFKQVRNAPRLKEMRLKMLKGEWPKECIRCEKEEDSNLRSRREFEREHWFIDNEFAKSKTSNAGEITYDDFPIHYLDLRFGNKCNLACRMCGPQDSSGWYKDYEKLFGEEYFYDTHGKVNLRKGINGKFNTDDYDWHEEDIFWKHLDEIAGDVTHIYMAGGEPLLIEKHYDFLNKCIEKDYAKNIILDYNTNMTVLDTKTAKMWEKFKEVRVGASVDGFGKVFEYQRYPAKWNIVYKNLKFLDDLPKNVISWFALTVTNYNIFHLSDFIKWKHKESGLKRVSSSKGKPFMNHHMCHAPDYLSIKSLHYDLKQEVIGEFIDLRAWAKENDLSAEEQIALDKLLKGIETFMMSEHYNEAWSVFVRTTKRLDGIRGENVLDVVPQFKDYF